MKRTAKRLVRIHIREAKKHYAQSRKDLDWGYPTLSKLAHEKAAWHESEARKLLNTVGEENK